MTLLIAGCVTSQSYNEIVGTGRIDLNAGTWAHFQKYQKQENGGAFAYNPRTGYAIYNYCPETQCEVSDKARDAIASCKEKSGEGCKLFGQNADVVWRGPVYVGGRLMNNAGSGLAAAAPRSAAISVSAAFRIVSKSDPAPWQTGKMDFTSDGQSDLFTAKFGQSVTCSGAMLGKRQFSTSTKYFTRSDVKCLSGGVWLTQFEGFLTVIAKHTGQITDTDGQNRKIEIAFKP